MNDMERSDDEMTPRSPKGRSWRKGLLIGGAVAVLVLLLAAVVYWKVTGVTSLEQGMQQLASALQPKENDVYRKKSYSVSDRKARNSTEQVIATAADAELTNGLLQAFYWMNVYDFLENYGYYGVYYGLDYTQPLDEQSCSESEGSWQHYFLDRALKNWHQYQALAKLAEEECIEMTEDLQKDLDDLRASMTETVLDAGYPSLDALIQADMGAGCTYEDYHRYMEIYYRGYSYLEQKMNAVKLTDQVLQEYFEAHAKEFEDQGITRDSGNVADVRHILIAVEGGTVDDEGEVTYSDEEWEACRQEAQEVLNSWLEEGATEENFAQLAYLLSEDTGSNNNGGLYESVDADSGFVPEFIDWYMDDSRKVGDYDLVRTEYGYHVMYFCGREPKWKDASEKALIAEKNQELTDQAVEQYPAEFDFGKIALGVVDFSQKQK